MTKKQKALQDFVRDYWKKNGRGPSFREMASALHKSVPAVHYMIQRMIKDGTILYEGRGLTKAPHQEEMF